MTPPFRAEHIGSLLRPQELLEARSKTPTSSNVFNTAQDEKYERSIFYGGFFENPPGFEIKELPIPSGFRTNFPTTTELHRRGVTTRPAPICISKISYGESPYLPEWTYLRSLLPEPKWRECKLTMPAPTWHHMQLAPGTAYAPSAYPNNTPYFRDLALAYQAEFKTLYSAGLRSIQIDDPSITYFFSDPFFSGCAEGGVDPDTLLDLYIDAHNHCLQNRPPDLHIGVHLCRGNFTGSTHFASDSYERIAEKLFGKLD